MSEYSPFLKLKDGEIRAIGDVQAKNHECLHPFFEVPRDNSYTSESLEKRIRKSSTLFKKLISRNIPIYLDNFEVPDDIEINGKDSYNFLLSEFKDFKVTPVAGIERSHSHNDICIRAGLLTKSIAIRITSDAMSVPALYINPLVMLLNSISSDVQTTLIFDFKIMQERDVESTLSDFFTFASALSGKLQIHRYLLSGSSIQVANNEMAAAGSTNEIHRKEIEVFRRIIGRAKDKSKICIGDYAVVSPEISELEIDPRFLASRMCPKIIYTDIGSHIIARGRPLMREGWEQYKELAKFIANHNLFRGRDFSSGDEYIYNKKLPGTGNSSPGAMIRHTVNSHIEFMLSRFKTIFE